MGNLYVVDASVILKWVLPADNEPWQEQAWAIFSGLRRREIEAAVPSLWWYETGNILTRKYPEQAAAHLAALTRILGDGHPMTEPSLRSTTLDLVGRRRVTFYDASYHALAIVLESVLVTADTKYLQAVSDEKHIMHLKDWR